MKVDWESVFAKAAGPIAALDLDGHYVQVNAAFCGLLGCQFEQVDERGFWCHAGTPVGAELAAAVLSAASDHAGGSFDLEHQHKQPDGSKAWLALHVGVVRDDKARPQYLLVVARDITERREAEALWEAMFEHSPIGVGLLDLEGRWERVNPALCGLLGRSSTELVGTPFRDLTLPTDELAGVDALEDLLSGKRSTITVERRYRHRDGHPIWLLIRTTLLPSSDGRPARILSYYEDIGERRLADERLAHLALHDPLTGLANRALLADRLQAARARLVREAGAVAVLFCDLDDFKPINDQCGHAAGDQLLIAAAEALNAATRSTDTVARVGGDEFVVVAHISREQDARLLRDKLEQALKIDLIADSRRLALSGTVGLATLADPHGDLARLMQRADVDMYARKTRAQRIDQAG